MRKLILFLKSFILTIIAVISIITLISSHIYVKNNVPESYIIDVNRKCKLIRKYTETTGSSNTIYYYFYLNNDEIGNFELKVNRSTYHSYKKNDNVWFEISLEEYKVNSVYSNILHNCEIINIITTLILLGVIVAAIINIVESNN